MSESVNILTATTTQVKGLAGKLKRIVVNKDVANSVITVYNNTTAGTLGADADGVSTTQTPVGAGNLTITGALASGGVATLGYNRAVTITSDGNDSGVTFTVTGTNFKGETISEVKTGPNAGTVTTTAYFLTVTQVAISGAGTGNITVGAAAQSGTKMATITAPATLLQTQYDLEYDAGFSFGLTIVTGSTADITVVFE